MNRERASKVSILHLSDIHFRKKEKEGFRHFHASIQKKMVKEIEAHINEHNVPDFTVITGDISFDGKSYKKAKEYFNKLKEKLPGSIFLPVPGNHDVDRGKVNEYFSLHKIIQENKVNGFIENKKQIRQFILPKFRKFIKFANGLNPDIYETKDNYFWVKNFPEKKVCFLGLNSAWACEGDNDRFNIALGYPQVLAALEESGDTGNCILLMHHPVFNWLNEQDFSKCKREIFKSCSLVLHGHTHIDDAFSYKDLISNCIFIGASASYTREENCYIGFQFEDVEFKNSRVKVRVWPYIFDERTGEFGPDVRRWGIAQDGNAYYDVDTRQTILEEPNSVPLPPIPQKYREWIESFHSTLSIDQLSKKGEVIKISLPELYIHLETANPFYKLENEIGEKKKIEALEKKAHVGEKGDQPTEPETIDVEILLGRVNCILLRGAAGMGKTTLIKHLAYTLTHDHEKSSIQGSLPVLIFLKDLWPIYERELKKKTDQITFESLLKIYIEERHCPLKMKTIKSYISRNRALFLLDGLDEVPDRLRPYLIEIIAGFQFENSKNRFLITSRPHGVSIKAVESFGKYLHDINPLDHEKINDFISTWFRSISGQALGLSDQLASDMISNIRNNESISVFTKNPLLLTAVCILYQDGKRLPEQRADLYERIVDNLLYKRFQDPLDPYKVGLVKNYLKILAFNMQKNKLKSIKSYDAMNLLKEVYPRKEAECASIYKKRIEDLFNDIEPHCGLLNRLSNGEVEFSHLTFQEFLTAMYMIDKKINFIEFIEKGWWEETILLYIGLVSLNREKESNDLVKDVLEYDPTNEKNKIRLHLFGAKALSDMHVYKRDRKVLSVARKKLISLIESDVELEERFKAGELLGVLGDVRISSDTMIKVVAGEIIIGSETEEASPRERPEHKVYIEEFMISKYPVTNVEYKEFVNGGGYKNKNYWTEKGWRWLKKKRIIEPFYWHESKWNAPNFPVVGVNWYEASAYALWLTKRTGKKYRLPKEIEWEKAARGTDGRVYPWGVKFDENRCNCNETGLNRTSPVGIFPEGKSPYGCLDMAGNVWEWCSDIYDEDSYKKKHFDKPKRSPRGLYRIIRGGSWYYKAVDCRTSYRNYFIPEVQWHFLGFRLCLDLK